MTDPHILYYVPLVDNNNTYSKFSPFQGFSTSLFDSFNNIRPIIRYCPPTIFEVYSFSKTMLLQRYLGLTSFCILPLELSEFPKLKIKSNQPFAVVLSNSETDRQLNAWSEKQIISPLVINLEKLEIDSLEQSLKGLIRDHCDSIVNLLKNELTDEFLNVVEDLRLHPQEKEAINLSFPLVGHNTTVPNELALSSIGAIFNGEDSPLIGPDENYVEKIVRSASPLISLRQSVTSQIDLHKISHPGPSLIMTAPGLYSHFFKSRKTHNKREKRIQKINNLIRQQKTYSYQLKNESHDESHDEANELMHSPEFKTIMSMRTYELNAYTNALSIRAASYLCPVFRLPLAVNHISGELTKLADCIRANPQSNKISNLAQKLYNKIKEAIPKEFLIEISKRQSSINLITDAPLEWLDIDGLPLMLRQTTSRIPVTPGNLSLSQILPPKQLPLTLNDFKETLIIRSFKSDDPIRPELEKAIKQYKTSNNTPLPVKFIDVKNKQELIEAFNSYHGAMVVLDTHGSHTKNKNIGLIHLAEENIDIWELREEINFPPIMFLCACDTHALNRTHATTANGLAFCGVRSVIATTLPILSANAAIATARFLFRIYEFLPALLEKINEPVRWSDVFSIFQRMLFISELIFLIKKEYSISTNRVQEVLPEAVVLCHLPITSWYELAIKKISGILGIPTDEIEKLRVNKLSFPESFKFIHLGNPDTIQIQPTSKQM